MMNNLSDGMCTTGPERLDACRGRRRPRGLPVLGLLLAMTATLSAAGPSPARPDIDRQGIRVWTHRVEGNPAVNYRATTMLNMTVPAAASLILDPEVAPRWAPYVHRIDVISPPDSAGETVFRMELDLPFPLQDRDVVVRARITRDSDGVFNLLGEAVADARAPARPGLIRITRYQGGWTIRPAGPGQVEVTTRGYADLGGAVPLSLSNRLVPQQLYWMLSNMRDQAGQAALRKMTAAVDG